MRSRDVAGVTEPHEGNAVPLSVPSPGGSDPCPFGSDSPRLHMVDFQSRDTSRGLSDEEDDEQADEDAAADDEADVETQTTPEDAAGSAEEATGHVEEQGTNGVAVVATGPDATAARDVVLEELDAADYAIRNGTVRAEDHDGLQVVVNEFVDRGDVCAVVTVGGTGVAPSDRTVDAVSSLTTKSLPGFGEAFRRQWSEEIDHPVVGSRVSAGIAEGTPIFCLPAEPEAAAHAARELVGPQAAAIHDVASGP